MVFVYFAFWGLQKELNWVKIGKQEPGTLFSKTAGSAPDAAMILGLFSQKILRLTLIISYIELFIFI
jgi:hypothetical protein